MHYTEKEEQDSKLIALWHRKATPTEKPLPIKGFKLNHKGELVPISKESK